MTEEEKIRFLQALTRGGETHIGQVVMDNHGTMNIHNGGQEDGRQTPAPADAVTPAHLAKAVESCADYFWGNSSWAVVFCVCRDCCDYRGSMADFERLADSLPLSRPLSYKCTEGTIQKTLSNNPYMQRHVTKWQQLGGKERALLLAEVLESHLTPQP